jgi:type I restriction enzyme, S subunit
VSTRSLRSLAMLTTCKVAVDKDAHVDLGDVEAGATAVWAPRSASDRGGEALLARRGDVVYGRLRPNLRKTFVSDRDLTVSTEFLVLRPAVGSEPRFVGYVVRDPAFADRAAAAVYGAKMPRVSWEIVRDHSVADFDLAAQSAIAAFLDREGDRLAAAAKSGLKLAEAAAASLRMDRERTFSNGSPRRLRTLLAAAPCYGVLVPQLVADGVPYVRVGDLKDLAAKTPSGLAQIPVAQSQEYSRTVVAAGDVLVSVVGSLDKAAVVTEELDGANVARAVARLRPIGISPAVLHAWTQTESYLAQARLATGSDTAQPTLNMGDLAAFVICVPTDLAAAERNLRRLASLETNILAASATLQRRVTEYRDSLVHEAVTGKLDVTKVSERQMEERLHAASEGRLDEVTA